MMVRWLIRVMVLTSVAVCLAVTVAFVGRLRDVIDIGTVTTDLDATVRAAVRPTTLRLWLRRGPTR